MITDLVFLWLWCRLAAVAPIRPLAWELPYAAGAALKSKKKEKKKEKEMNEIANKEVIERVNKAQSSFIKKKAKPRPKDNHLTNRETSGKME